MKNYNGLRKLGLGAATLLLGGHLAAQEQLKGGFYRTPDGKRYCLVLINRTFGGTYPREMVINCTDKPDPEAFDVMSHGGEVRFFGYGNDPWRGKRFQVFPKDEYDILVEGAKRRGEDPSRYVLEGSKEAGAAQKMHSVRGARK